MPISTTEHVTNSRALSAPNFHVVLSETASKYLPLFDHLSLSQPQKLQLIADLLSLIDHAFDAYYVEETEASKAADDIS
jgi:hypothetical protein